MLTRKYTVCALCAWMVAALGLGLACVPNGPSKSDAGANKEPAATTKKPPKAPASTTPKPARSAPPSQPLTAVFEDKFERASLGSDWFAVSSSAWQIHNGKLCGRGARNKGVWLLRALPVNARIEFQAMSESDDGDLKAEFWGDGRSGATSTSYTNATSYLTIFGGWKNTFHVLARIDEHASDRQEVALSPDSVEEREKPVVAKRMYNFVVERSDGKTVSWTVDGVLIHKLEDKAPLTGPGHDHFGFNDWEVPVCFDDLKVTPLAP